MKLWANRRYWRRRLTCRHDYVEFPSGMVWKGTKNCTKCGVWK